MSTDTETLAEVQVVARARRNGKTTEAVEWVLAGEATDSYPFWTRVLLVPTIDAADNARRQFPALDYRQVFAWSEWQRARLGALPVEVAVDNADILIAQTIGQVARLVTLTGAARVEQARAGETALREAAANAVRRLHRCTTLEGVAAACWEGDCDHPECHNGGESPVREFKVCKHCTDLAEESGLMEESWPAWIMWPCATAVAVGFADQAALTAALDTTGGTP